jgi:hypothetical protein
MTANIKGLQTIHNSPLTKKIRKKIIKKIKIFWDSKRGTKLKMKFSKERMGDKNPVHRQTPETRERIKINNSIKMKNLILSGKFVPPVTNSWSFSRIIINNIPFRSSWEAVFYILNPTLEYEKVVIPYMVNNIKKNYIVDFVDHIDKIIYEIKPKATKQNAINLIKEKAALKWAKKNKYEYVCISNEYFEQNANKIDYAAYEPKLKKSMNQFLK